ncbi:MAG TPA: hypothetical protein VEQ85_10610 [Lacipirellulaceae bacterium]|nr:hypothetical protein [Lacipirellulaceae bacterium]
MATPFRFRGLTVLRQLAWAVAPLAALGCGAGADAQGTATTEAPTARSAAGPDSATEPQQWVRLVRDGAGEPLAMETAIVRFVPAADYRDGRAAADYDRYVDLVGAVHIGDAAYYATLNKRFRDYDAVLYELVAKQGTVVPRGRGISSSNPLGALQNGMKSMLEVEHQLEQVDYTRPNFVHADLSPDEFLKSMESRDESFLDLYLRVVTASLAQQSEAASTGSSPEMEIMVALLASDRARRLKIILAKQFEGMESLMLAFNGSEGSTLINGRNTRALDVLEQQLAEGDRRLAIFYGAGHLGDMQEQLEKRFEMRPVSTEWLEAWTLRK